MLIVIPFKRVPDGATDEQRRAMYEDWLAVMRRANPRHFNVDGTQKEWWQVLWPVVNSSQSGEQVDE